MHSTHLKRLKAIYPHRWCMRMSGMSLTFYTISDWLPMIHG